MMNVWIECRVEYGISVFPSLEIKASTKKHNLVSSYVLEKLKPESVGNKYPSIFQTNYAENTIIDKTWIASAFHNLWHGWSIQVNFIVMVM